MNFNSNEQNASLKPRNINKKYSMIDKIEKDKNIIDIILIEPLIITSASHCISKLIRCTSHYLFEHSV